MELREKVGQLPFSPGVYLYKDAARPRDLRRQGQEPAQPRPQLLLRGQAGRHQDRHAHLRSPRRRLHPGRQRKRSAGARKQPHQAVQAALQHPAARRQNLSLHQAHQREVPARLRHPPPAQGRRHLLRPVLPRQPRAPPGALHPPPLPGALLQGGSHPLPPQALPAVPHSPLPGPLRAGPHHRRSLRRAPCATCACSSKAATATWRATCARAWKPPADEMRFEEAAALRDLLATVEEIEERQKMAAAKGDDVDIFAVYAEPPLVAAEPVPPAQRPDRRPPRVLLGRPARVRRAAVLLARCSSRSTSTSSTSRPKSTSRWSSKTARRWRSCSPKSATARWRSAPRSAARRRRCSTWWRPTPSTASTRASAC